MLVLEPVGLATGDAATIRTFVRDPDSQVRVSPWSLHFLVREGLPDGPGRRGFSPQAQSVLGMTFAASVSVPGRA